MHISDLSSPTQLGNPQEKIKVQTLILFAAVLIVTHFLGAHLSPRNLL